MHVKTIGDLKREIDSLPDDLPIEGYDGSDQPKAISVWVQDFEDVETEPKPDPVFTISTD